MIFVFGSNLAGRHGAGSALVALRRYGATYGQGVGLQGQAYGIPTKDHQLRVLPLAEIEGHVRTFITFAETHRDLTFSVVRIGCGLAGYRDDEIAPMFSDAPSNCILPDGWRGYRG
jgi:hypothetical protein